MVKGIARRKKTYVEVEAVHFSEGYLKPLTVKRKDGRTWEIDSVVGHTKAQALKVSGTGYDTR